MKHDHWFFNLSYLPKANFLIFRPSKNDSYFTFCSQEEDIETSDFEVDYDFFYEAIWPKLAHRIPLFECIKVRNVSEYLIETCFW